MYGGNQYGSIPYGSTSGGQNQVSDEINSQITGASSVNSEINSQITGKGIPDEINSEIRGKSLENSEINSEITGLPITDEINSEIEGLRNQNNEIDSEITGSLHNTDINSEIVGKQFFPIERTYRIIVKNEDGIVIGEFDHFRSLKFGKRLNNYGTASFDIPVSDEKASEIVALRKNTVWIYYQVDGTSTLVWSGEQAMREGQLDNAGNNWCTIHCFDWLEQLNGRYTVAEKRYENIDAGQIAWTMINETQTQVNGDFGITEGVINATVNRDRTYYNQNIMEAIVNLSGVISGFDFEITNDKVFNASDVIGVDRTNEIILEYGHNMESAQIVEDFVHPVNRAIVLGQSTDDLNDLVRVERNNLTSQAEFKLREDVLSEMDVSETDTMEEKGDAMLRKYENPLMKIDINMASVKNPNITEFGLGDAITLIIKSGIYDIQSDYRVFEWEVTYEDNNTDHLTVILGNFTYE